MVEALGASALRTTELRYALTPVGRDWAAEALAQNRYIGAVPVSLAQFTHQILRQRISNERVDRERILQYFSNIIVTDDLVRRLGPAINSMKAMLLFGPPGNGKTTIAEKVGRIFKDIIYIPHAIEVDGQIIKIFDPAVHEIPETGGLPDAGPGGQLRGGGYDQRWVPCRRPLIMAGGELTLEMLDLQFNQIARFYEAPLHIKAINGTLHHRRLRPSDHPASGIAEPLDRAVGEPGGLSETAYRQQRPIAVRRVRHLFHQPDTGRPG